MLYFNSIFIMDSAGIVIRIKTPLGDMDSSVDCPSLLNFSDLLVAIRDVMPEATVTAFEYEDEVGDRITVRSDEELKAMLSYVMHPADVRLPFQYAVQTKKGIQHPRVERPLRLRRRKYCSTMNEQRMNGQLPEPLQIFPRAGKTPGIRNIHGLKVNTRPNPANDCTTGVTDTMANNSLKKSSAELKRILTTGQINAQDIQYQEQLGQGNGGTVYKAYHLLGKRVLAVKVIPLDITVELQKQIMSELEILYKCDSPYIITFFSAFFVENRISICTEFMDGSKRPNVPVELKDTSQRCQALQYAGEHPRTSQAMRLWCQHSVGKFNCQNICGNKCIYGARTDIRGTVWYPCRCLECWNLFHGVGPRNVSLSTATAGLDQSLHHVEKFTTMLSPVSSQ
ncbi:dual specificity mitogen-activated protein kinase kinase 5 isoform X5 [Phyllopteryx taeniolatus]|uniref:dual specificity mitogen-activated protein kinase kinase 5 isoform X5 n=1 Tax=Phyllopteryx taeniolatus TaxID=161469 RepID=UPI002AD2A37D|nr:dual specificity mitogen-activated protein kinase kinase 5 isoform X5 [Phyllopteryx taeniolatus]